MTSKPLTAKSKFTTRRKVIIYIIASILILGIVAGFTNTFTSDNRKFSAAWGETIVIEAETPESGSPADYDLMSNLKYTAYRLHHASFFKGTTSGKVIADIKLGSYTQNINNTRVALGGNRVFSETISSSSLKSVAEQKYAYNDIIIYRPSTGISGNTATFSDKAYQMSFEEYGKKYGTIPNQLSKYIINEKTVTSVKDENSGHVRAVNAAADGGHGFDFYVPENLTPGPDGNYKFSLTLDPFESTLYYRNEVRTLGGADQNPVFHSVRITVTIDDNWNPITVRSVENYDIAIPVLGAMNCTSDLTETFTQISDENGIVPETDFFQPYIDKALSNPGYTPPDIEIPGQLSASDYLATAFAGYMSGEQTLDLKADIKLGDFSIYDLVLSADLKTSNIRAMLGDVLYIGYSGDRINIKLNGINGYIKTSDLQKLTEDERLAAIFGTIGALDPDKIFGGDMLDVIFRDCNMTEENGIVRIPLSFEMDLSDVIPQLGKVKIDAAILINDEDKSLRSIAGTVTVAGKEITANISPLKKAPKFPSVAGAADLSDAVGFIPDILATALQKTYGIDGKISVNGCDIGVSAYIDRTNGLVADAVISVLGLDISVKYADNVLFVGIGNIKVRGTSDDLPLLIDSAAKLFGTDLGKYADVLKLLLPTSLNDAVGIIRSLTADGNSLKAEFKFLTIPVAVSLTRADGRLNAVGINADADIFGFKLEADAELKLSEPERKTVSIPTENCITFGELAGITADIEPYLNSDKNFEIILDGNIGIENKRYSAAGELFIDRTKTVDGTTEYAAYGAFDILGQKAKIVYKDGTAYAAIGDIKIKIATADIGSLFASVFGIVGNTGATAVLPEINIGDAIGAVKSLVISPEGSLVLTINTASGDATAALNIKTGKLVVRGNINGCETDISADLTLTERDHGIAAPSDKDEYLDAAVFGTMADTLAAVITQKGLSAVTGITLNGKTYAAQLSLSFANGELMLSLKENSLPLDITVTDGTAYMAVGDVKIRSTVNELKTIAELIKDSMPAQVVEYLRETAEKLSGMLSAGSGSGADNDISAVISNILASVTELSVQNGSLVLGMSFNGIHFDLNVSPTLSDICGTVFIPSETTGAADAEISLFIKDLNAGAQNIITPDASLYVSADEFVSVLGPILPYAKEQALDINFDVSVFGQTVTGSAYIDLGSITTGLQAQTTLDIAGMPVVLTIKDDALYLDINNGGICIIQSLTEDGIMSALTSLDQALPELKISETLQQIADISSADILNMIRSVSLTPLIDGGFAVSIEIGGKNYVIDILTQDGELHGMEITGGGINIRLNAKLENGRLAALHTVNSTVSGTRFSANIDINGSAKRELNVSEDNIAIEDLVPYIAPIKSLADEARSAKTVTIDLDMTAAVFGNSVKISGPVTLSLDPFAINADLYLFADSADKTLLSVKYVDGTLFVKTGKIKLSFDTASDLGTLYASIEKYLPESLKNLKNNMSELSSISALINSFKQISGSSDTESVLNILFDTNNAKNKSVIKQAADMISVFTRGEDRQLGIAVTVMDIPFAIVLNVTPVINNGNIDINVKTDLGSVLSLDASAKLSFGAEQSAAVLPPHDKSDYVPITAFAKTLIDAVNTLTAKAPDIVTTDPEGNTATVSQTAFELDEFKFDYDIFKLKTETDADGNTVTVTDKQTGRPVVETDADGNKITDSRIEVSNIPGRKALRFALTSTSVTDADGKTVSVTNKIAIEAHIVLGIKSGTTYKNGFPAEIDLYVAPTAEHPEGLAYLFYKEADGHGEKISIDYTSVMQIAAALMDIIGADDELIDSLLKEYRLPIDTSLFDSMSVAGFDTLRQTVNTVADAAEQLKLGLADIKAAWNSFRATKTVDELVAEFTGDVNAYGQSSVKALLTTGIEYIKNAIGKLGIGNTDISDTADPDAGMINGALFGKITDSVEFAYETGKISATVDNAAATGADGYSTITVCGSENKIDTIEVDNLDINTARLNTFAMTFTSGRNISIEIPSDFDTADGNVTYSDFSNITHLLFDVMNTANLKEFQIGGLDTSDTINVKLNLGSFSGLANMDLNIRYDIKVKIIPSGTDQYGKTIYKTAAAVELQYKDFTATILGAKTRVVADCITRLYFYDDVLYVQGVRDWGTKTEDVGMLTDIRYDCKRKGSAYTQHMTIQNHEIYSTETAYIDYVNVMYTIDEFMWMIENDMTKFMHEFLFYLVPLSKSFTIAKINLQDTIIDQIAGSSSDTPAVNTDNTFAKIFKGYTYNGSTHTLTLGLKELAGNNALSDLVVSITGMNDGDDDGKNGNIRNNYISALTVHTDIQNSLITVDLSATLNNIRVSSDNSSIYSSGFAPSDVTLKSGAFSMSGKNYIKDYTGYEPDTLYMLDGTAYEYRAEDGNVYLYTDHGRLPAVYRPVGGSDITAKTTSSCSNKGSNEGYKFGDLLWEYTWTYTLDRGYCIDDITDRIYYVGTGADGSPYVYRMENGVKIPVRIKSIINDFLAQVERDGAGNIVSVTNRNGGIQWVRPWQSVYGYADAA